jgi:hypothetical protein
MIESLGVIRFYTPHNFDERWVTIVVDVLAVEADWQRTAAHQGYLSRGKGVKFEGIIAKMRDRRDGDRLEMPRSVLCHDGKIGFENGRHRFAYFRDRGVRRLPFRVPKKQAAEFHRLYSWHPRRVNQ